MSGQPNKTPTDASKFRQAYMSNLKLRISLDDKNLQANKIYKRTGQVPEQPSDFRTTEEKFADVLTLRKDVRSQLGKIADGVNANKIAQELSPAELVFYYQQSPTINNLIKDRYSKGVVADIFITFLRKYMVDTIANKGVSSGLQQVSGQNMLLSGENITRRLATAQDYYGLAEAYRGSGVNIMKQIADAIDLLPPDALYQRIDGIADESEKFRLLEEANNYLKDLPSKGEISAKIRNVSRLKQTGDANALRTETASVLQLITPSNESKIQKEDILTALRNVEPDTGNIDNLASEYDYYYNQGMNPMNQGEIGMYDAGYGDDSGIGKVIPSDIFGGLEIKDPTQYGKADAPEEEVLAIEPVPQQGGVRTQKQTQFINGGIQPFTPPVNPMKKGKPANLATMLNIVNNIEDLINFDIESIIFFFDEMETITGVPMFNRTTIKQSFLGKTRKDFEKEKPEKRGNISPREVSMNLLLALNQDMNTNQQFKGYLDAVRRAKIAGSGFGRNPLTMMGRGILVQERPKRRFDNIRPDQVDFSRGIPKPIRYVPFGRYLLNQIRLNDNIISVKRPSGGTIVEFPTQMVSSNLVKVMKKIIGDGMPCYEDLEALDEDEKVYLNRLAKSSQIIDRLSIPAPNKSENEKDLNRFEILKGQITSGNDNKELIKEFKILLLKLSNRKLIPKPQVRDLLFDLTSLGF
jgi:hypothetical protein